MGSLQNQQLHNHSKGFGRGELQLHYYSKFLPFENCLLRVWKAFALTT